MSDTPGTRRLVSACMAGTACRYDGRAKTYGPIAEAVDAGEAVPVCPEMLGGLSSPRRPAEIVGGDGDDVLDGSARVVDDEGRDVTDAVLAGARQALAVAQAAGVTEAVLKEGSPSCGSSEIADGSFSGTRRPGRGVTTALLRRHGIAVVSEHDEAAHAGEEAGDQGQGGETSHDRR